MHLSEDELSEYRQKKDDAMRGYRTQDEQEYPHEPESRRFSEHDGDSEGLHGTLKIKKGKTNDRMPSGIPRISVETESRYI